MSNTTTNSGKADKIIRNISTAALAGSKFGPQGVVVGVAIAICATFIFDD